MSFKSVVFAIVIPLLPVSAWADDVADLRKRVDQLEADLRHVQLRFDKLGAASTVRQVRIANPVFIGAGTKNANSLAMDNETINCPAKSFITAVQILKTGNTVTQIRYACRALE